MWNECWTTNLFSLFPNGMDIFPFITRWCWCRPHVHGSGPGHWWMVKSSSCHSNWHSGNMGGVFMDQAGICVAKNPVAELGDTGINPRPVDLGTADTPTHYASQEEPAWGPLTHQRPPRVTLQGEHESFGTLM